MPLIIHYNLSIAPHPFIMLWEVTKYVTLSSLKELKWKYPGPKTFFMLNQMSIKLLIVRKYTNKLTPWSRVLLEKLTVIKRVKNLSVLMEHEGSLVFERAQKSETLCNIS